MKPPTEEQLNEEVDDGYGLQLEGEPTWFIQAELELKEAELDALEITMEMTTDRWEKEEKFLLSMIRSYELSLEFELEWQDEVDLVAVAREREKLQEAKDKYKKEKQEFEEGKEKAQENIDHKKRQILVVRDVLRRSHVGHF